MADLAEIEEVQQALGGAEYAEENGYDGSKIEDLLDIGETLNSIAAKFWEGRWTASAELIDISESGSSRGLSAVTKNAKDLAALYRGRADSEVGNPTPTRGIRSHRMKRV
jgi:hypothetical protein